MEKELFDKLRSYESGTVIDLSWSRGNGDLSAYYLFFGIVEGKPILKRYEEGRTLEQYENDAVFDILNPDLFVKKIIVDASKSAKSLDTLFKP